MVKWLKQLFWILFFWELGQIVSFLSCGFYPGEIIGMFFLFFALFSGVLKKYQVEKISELLMKHILLFLLPVTFGVISRFHIISPFIGTIILSFVLSTLAVTAVFGFLGAYFLKKSKNDVVR